MTPPQTDLNEEIEALRQRVSQLAGSRKRLQALFDYIQDAILLADDEGRYVDANPAACDLTGYSRAELIGMGVWDLTPEGDREAGRRHWQAFRAAGEMRGEYTLQRKDGSQIDTEYRAVADIEPGLHLSTMRDIGARKRAEAALKQSEATLRGILAATPVGIALMAGRRVQWINERVITLTGYSREELLGQDTRMLYDSEEEYGRVGRALYELLEQRGIGSTETYLLRKDGSLVDTVITAAPMPSTEFDAARLVTLLDVSNLRQTERALLRSRDRYRALFEDAPVSLWEQDYSGALAYLRHLQAGGVEDMVSYLAAHPEDIRECLRRVRVVDTNTASLKLYEAEDKSSLLQSLIPLTGEEALLDQQAASLAALARGATGHEMHLQNRTLKGRLVHVFIRWTVLPGHEADYSRVLLSALDTTPIMEAESALQTLQRRIYSIVRNTPVVVYATDKEGIFTLSEGQVLRRVGLRSGELVGQSAYERFGELPFVLNSGEVLPGRDLWRRVLAGEVVSASCQIEDVIFENAFTPTYGENGEIVGLAGVAYDVSEQRQAETRLRSYIAHLAALHEVDAAILAAHSPADVAAAAGDYLLTSLPYDRMAVIAYQGETEEYQVLAARRTAAGVEQDWLSDQYLAGLRELLAGGELVMAEDIAPICSQSPFYLYLMRQGVCSFLLAPLFDSERFIGAMILAARGRGGASPQQRRFVQDLANQMAIALRQSQMLQREQSARRELQNLAGYLQETREEERSRIAREIHDELGQTLTALKFDVMWLNRRLDSQEEELLAKTAQMSAHVDGILQEVRRIATELRPGLLDNLGLQAALEWQAETFSQRTGLAVRLHFGAQRELDLGKSASTAVFRIFQEALTNVARHARATEVDVRLRYRPPTFELSVTDNGVGIGPGQMRSAQSLGLLGMRERAQAHGGSLQIRRLARGTEVRLRLPLRSTGREVDHDSRPGGG